MKTYTSFNQLVTSQRQAIPGREAEQIVNAAGGYVFKLDPWKQMERFLVLGSEGGTFYVKERALTRENAINVIACIDADGRRAVDLIVDVSNRGLAPKNDPAIFALALAASAKSPDTRVLALAALTKVCRIPTHLFHFVTYVKQFRGMGRGLKRALGNWYQAREVDNLAYTCVKYQSRDGVSNRDVLRLSHPKTADPARNAVYKWITDGFGSFEESEERLALLPNIIKGFEYVKGRDAHHVAQFIKDYNLSREMVPTESLKDPKVWEALLEKMPPGAILRNLGNMSKVGLLIPLSEASKLVVRKLTDKELLKRERVHPLAILIASKVYGLGHGILGGGVWNPVSAVVDALNDAFYLGFDYIQPTGQSLLLAVDVSGSMNAQIAGMPMSAAEGAAVMALACARTEANYEIVCFNTRVTGNLKLSKTSSLKEVETQIKRLAGGATDCSAPIDWARGNKVKADAIGIFTDNETWAGKYGHPSQCMTQYRQQVNQKAKIINVGMTATNATINDPTDARALDIVGFSADVPAVLTSFLDE